MTEVTYNQSGGSFSIGELLNSSFRILHAAFPRFIALALIPVLPLLLALFGIGSVGDTGEFPIGFFASGAIVTVLVFALYLMTQAAMIYGAFCQMRGRAFTIGEALSKGLARALPLLGVAIISSVAILLGLLAFAVPGLILICMLYVVVPTCVVEGRGVFESLSRSSDLTSGYRWPILGLFLIVFFGSTIASEMLVGLVKSAAGETTGDLVDTAVQMYTIAFGSVLTALVYYRLRAIKEGIDIDRVADVFD